jgi:hypothetical protein
MRAIKALADWLGDSEDNVWQDKLLKDWIIPMANQGGQVHQQMAVPRRAWRQNDPMVPVWK